MLLEAQLLFASPSRGILHARSHGRHGSREETRRLRVSPELVWCRDWPTPVRFLEVRSIVREHARTTTQTRYYLTDLSPSEASPGRLLQLVRGHWGIENRLHYVRDVTFDEDRCTIRTGNAPRVVATIRNLTIALLRACRMTNIAAALRSFSYTPRRALQLVTTTPHRKTQ